MVGVDTGEIKVSEQPNEELTELPSLMAAYCRLVDDSGLVTFGDTELEAISKLFD